MNPREILKTKIEEGKYQKNRGRLCDGNSFCILGVICDIYMNEHPYTRYKWKTYDYLDPATKQIYEKRTLLVDTREPWVKYETFPPHAIINWLGISEEETDILTTMNDNEERDYSLEYLADLIVSDTILSKVSLSGLIPNNIMI